jgi:hypothetical protein
MNPRETQSRRIGRDNLSVIEAHVKADSMTPACRSDRLCDPPVFRRRSSERSRWNMVSSFGAKLCPSEH